MLSGLGRLIFNNDSLEYVSVGGAGVDFTPEEYGYFYNQIKNYYLCNSNCSISMLDFPQREFTSNNKKILYRMIDALNDEIDLFEKNYGALHTTLSLRNRIGNSDEIPVGGWVLPLVTDFVSAKKGLSSLYNLNFRFK